MTDIEEEQTRKKSSKQPVVITAFVALVIGVAIGYFALNIPAQTVSDSNTSVSQGIVPIGSQTITDEELLASAGVITYVDGTSTTFTNEQVIEQSKSLENSANDDGAYTLPTGDMILNYARNEVLMKEVTARGITVSDDEFDAYVTNAMGSADIGSLAEAYGLSEEGARLILTQASEIQKLHDEVVTPIPDAPVAPVAPEDDAMEDATQDFMEYIIGLAGDEWSPEASTWADPEGDYAVALAQYDISDGEATYAAAQSAYQVAYTYYTKANETANTQWNEYLNSLYCNASLNLESITS